jgi:hypothetical protein
LVRETFLAGSENDRSASKHREHTTAMAQTSQGYGEKTDGTRTPGTPNA